VVGKTQCLPFHFYPSSLPAVKHLLSSLRLFRLSLTRQGESRLAGPSRVTPARPVCAIAALPVARGDLAPARKGMAEAGLRARWRDFAGMVQEWERGALAFLYYYSSISLPQAKKS
jgi:hypothetical protein